MKMKKFINDPFDVVDEMLEGILLAHPDHLRSVGDTGRALVWSRAPVEKKVGIVTGGGAGHLPVFLGYVGEGLADGAAVGNVFSSPGPQPMLDCIRAADSGHGVLIVVGNYQGDLINFREAAERARNEGIRTEMVIISDDVASAPASRMRDRRGVAGLFYAYKLAGAMAQEGLSLEQLKAALDEAVSQIRSIGVASGACIVPASGVPTFEIADDEMELGMGIHGEPGLERIKLLSADALAVRMADLLLEDLPLSAGDEVSVLVNGLGATPNMELYIVFRKFHSILTGKKIGIYKTFIGEYATSLEMSGLSISIFKLNASYKKYIDAMAYSPFLPAKR
jgi:dihydroxyacetone kinase